MCINYKPSREIYKVVSLHSVSPNPQRQYAKCRWDNFLFNLEIIFLTYLVSSYRFYNYSFFYIIISRQDPLAQADLKLMGCPRGGFELASFRIAVVTM